MVSTKITKSFKYIFSVDVLGVSEIQTNKFKSADDVKEKEKAGQESNPDLVEQIGVCPVTKRPSIWYFQEISPDKLCCTNLTF